MLYTEFNEPQRGKDQCDRDSAVIKKLIEYYVNSGHDATSAAEIHAALLSFGGIRNVKPSVIELSPQAGFVDKKSLKGISSYHSASFESEDGIVFWRYHDIGPGLQSNLKIDDVNQKIVFNVVIPFPDEFSIGREAAKKTNNGQNLMLFCHDERCLTLFTNNDELQKHLSDGKHSFLNETELLTSEDKMKAYYVSKMKTGFTHRNHEPVLVETHDTEVISSKYIAGYALKQRKVQVRLTVKQKTLLRSIRE
jgi:hypothetical protein